VRGCEAVLCFPRPPHAAFRTFRLQADPHRAFSATVVASDRGSAAIRFRHSRQSRLHLTARIRSDSLKGTERRRASRAAWSGFQADRSRAHPARSGPLAGPVPASGDGNREDMRGYRRSLAAAVWPRPAALSRYAAADASASRPRRAGADWLRARRASGGPDIRPRRARQARVLQSRETRRAIPGTGLRRCFSRRASFVYARQRPSRYFAQSACRH